MTAGRGSRLGEPADSSAHATARWSLPRGQVLRRAREDDPARQYFLRVPIAARPVLVAPYFSHGHSADYQRLGRTGRGPRADAALHAILEEVAWLTGASTARIHLFGFSGGAQFAHRYAMAHPQRVARAVVAASGWYTFPDSRTRFPYGIRSSRDLPGVRFDPEEFLRVPITVIVGDRDTSSEDLRSTRRASRQGADRVERARNWVEAMRAAARACRYDPAVTLDLIPGGDHSFASLMESGGLGERVFAALFGASSPPAAGNGRG